MDIRSELIVLAWGALLLLVHILAPVHVKTRQYGTRWNMGARDEEMPPPSPVAARLERARDNYMETLPIAIIGTLGVVVADRATFLTGLGAHIWLFARIAYLPIYAAGIPRIRTIIWAISIVGLLMTIWPLLLP